MTRARLARPGRDELGGGDQGVDETRAGGLDVERRAVQLEPVLHQVGRRGEAHVGRERADDQQVDLGGIQPGRLQAAGGGVDAQVARRLVRQGEPALVDPRPVDDPLGVEPVRLDAGRGCVTTLSGT